MVEASGGGSVSRRGVVFSARLGVHDLACLNHPVLLCTHISAPSYFQISYSSTTIGAEQKVESQQYLTLCE